MNKQKEIKTIKASDRKTKKNPKNTVIECNVKCSFCGDGSKCINRIENRELNDMLMDFCGDFMHVLRYIKIK